jgi:glycosyltransferase involved in cell wall biosynthesis
MKILHLSTDDFSGGASKAAYRLHTALLQNGIDSSMRVLTHQTANDKVLAGRGPRSFIEKVKGRIYKKLRAFTERNWKTDNLIMHSFGQVSAGIVEEINHCDADVVNLHWVVNLLSIEDIGNIRKPIVWTLHDMWAFCGGEHVAHDDEASRFRVGYLPDNRPLGESGPDLNREAWESKQKHWANQTFNIVTPGRWMAGCVKDSVLFRNAAITVIPNPIEMQHLWRPVPRDFARRVLGLEQDKKYILSGSAGGMPHLKGEDLLKQAMAKAMAARDVARDSDEIELLIFGQYQPANNNDWPCKVHWLGPVRDDHVMTLIYSAADVMMVPSRVDNLPNTAIEAHACGIPVVAFNIGGLPDIVDHQHSGWLAPAFDIGSLAKGMLWVLSDPVRWQALSDAARKSAESRFAPRVVVEQYLRIYEQALRGSAAGSIKSRHKTHD